MTTHLTDAQRATAKRMFLRHGKSCAEIGHHFDVSRISIYKTLRKMGVEFRDYPRERKPRKGERDGDISEFRPETRKQSQMWKKLLAEARV
jgi:transposase